MRLPSKIDLILIGGLALCVIGFAIVVKKWHDDSNAYKLAKVEWSKTLESKNRELADMQANVEKANAASNKYHDELDRLDRERLTTPVRSVRLCHSPVRVPQATAGTTASGTPETGDEGLQVEVGPDIGARLYDLADQADQCAAQRDALIDWINNR